MLISDIIKLEVAIFQSRCASEPHFEEETLATVSKCPSLSRNNRNNRYIVRFIFLHTTTPFLAHARTAGEDLELIPPPPPPRKILKSSVFDENCYLWYIRHGESENDSPTTVDKGVGSHIATVAKDEKIWSPKTVFANNRYQDQIRYGNPGNHSPDEQRQRGGVILNGVAMTSSKILKYLNQH